MLIPSSSSSPTKSTVSTSNSSTRQCKSSLGKSTRFGEDIPRTFEDFLNQREDSDDEDNNSSKTIKSSSSSSALSSSINRREKSSKTNILNQDETSKLPQLSNSVNIKPTSSSSATSPNNANTNNLNNSNANIKFWDRKTKSFANMENAANSNTSLHIPDRNSTSTTNTTSLNSSTINLNNTTTTLKGNNSKVLEIKHSLELLMHDLDEVSHFESQKERENLLLKAKISELEKHSTLLSRISLTRDEIRKLNLQDLQILKLNVENTLGLIDDTINEKSK